MAGHGFRRSKWTKDGLNTMGLATPHQGEA
jgi:hypothetical protein